MRARAISKDGKRVVYVIDRLASHPTQYDLSLNGEVLGRYNSAWEATHAARKHAQTIYVRGKPYE